MKKKLLVIIVPIIIVISVIVFIIWNNRTVSYITLDINPSIMINLDKNNKVKNIIALNKDAEKIIKNIKDDSLNGTLNIIFNNIINSDFIDNSGIDIILYTDGKIKSKNVKDKIVNILDKNKISFDINVIREITNEDKKLAKKYNVSPAKASYINSIIKNKKGIDIKDLVNRSVSELNNTKRNGYYCDDDYILEGSWCLKEIKREKAPKGDICPDGYGDYKGVCYEEEPGRDGTNLICRDDFQLVGKKCVMHAEHDAIGKCSAGEYDHGLKKCIERKLIGDAIEYCRITPGEDLLYNGRCLGRKPTINGGCLGDDVVIDGWCYDTSPTSGYESDWMCNIDGEIQYLNRENSDGKCYKDVASDPVSYYCDDNSKVVDNKCILDESEDAMHEKICSSGFTKYDERCYNLNNSTSMVKGLYCDGPDTRLVDDSCIYYERIDAKKG